MKTDRIGILETLLFGALIGLGNWGLLAGEPRLGWVLCAGSLQSGEWFRFLSHPWVHVSIYHLLLDASAFLSLFWMLDRSRVWTRWSWLALSWAGAWLVVWCFEPAFAETGFCGLSGIAHGLFAAVAIEWIRDRSLRRLGWILLFLLSAKVCFEVCTGGVLLASFHTGSVGRPLTACHAGGFLGVLLLSLLKNLYRHCMHYPKFGS